MMTDRFPSLLVAAAGIAVLCFCPAPVAGQDKKNSFTASKGWYDQPDLQGIWVPAQAGRQSGEGRLHQGSFQSQDSVRGGRGGQARPEREERQDRRTW